MKHLLVSPLCLALSLAACEFAGNACAAERLTATPEFLSASSDARWQGVDDDVLSHQTGKGAGGTMVSGLVLQILSQWQMPDGGSATAQGALTISTNANNSVSAQVSTSAQARDGAAHGNGVGQGNASHGTTTSASATGGQLVSVNGVSQVTQVAGNGNVGMNSTVIDFNGESASSLASSGASGSNSSWNSSLSATATSASGNVKAGIAFGNGGVAVTVQTPAGVATQTITPAAFQGSGSIAQLLQIAGNGQAVVNQLQLSIKTMPTSAALLRQSGVLRALQNSALIRH
jgi:hypothetical protein